MSRILDEHIQDTQKRLPKGESSLMYNIIRTLYFRVKSAKHVPDKVHALTAFLEQAETLLERHGEFK